VPTYSYRCTECGTAFDIQQSFTDASLTVCPTCGGALRKIFSPVGISFSGPGFYRTDSRATPAGEKSGREASAATKTEKAAPAVKEKAASTPGTSSGTGKAATSSAASATS
jgi:putative FmdB family regulatory protein